jgi:hypothetical protein
MTSRTLSHSAQAQAEAQPHDGQPDETPQGPPPSPDDETQKKKSSADWTLPPHLRESLPLNPKGGRAPRPPASTAAS